MLADNPLMQPRWADDSAGDGSKDQPPKPGRTKTVLSDAFNNAHGQLHSDTGTPQGQRISKSKLLAASRGKFGPKAKKRAQPVLNMARARGG